MGKELNAEDKEKMALEMIGFLKKWGMWECVSIATNRCGYSSSDDHGKTYKGIAGVEYEEGIEPGTWMEKYPVYTDDGECEWRSCSNPEQIFDMVYSGPLYMLLNFGDYEARKVKVTPEAWEYIFEHIQFPGIFDEFLEEKYGCIDAEGLLELIISDKLDNPEYSHWDPLEFDTWEEYQELIGGEDSQLPLDYLRYDTYADFLREKADAENLTLEDVIPVWDKMLKAARLEFMNDCGKDGEDLIYLSEMAGYLKDEFDSIFERFGLWYDFCGAGSLSCYMKP